MPTWPLLTRSTAAQGIPALAQRAPNQALGQLAQGAEKAAGMFDQLAERDAALDGASMLADFHVKMAARQRDMQTKATSPEGYTAAATADFDQQAQGLLDSVKSPRTQSYLDQRLIAAREAHQSEALGWEASTRVDLRAIKATQTLDKFANIAATSPGRFQQVLGDFNAFVSEAGLPLDVAEKIRMTGRQTIARSAVQGQLETNAGGVVKALQSGHWDEYLDAGAKSSLLNAAQAEVKRAASEARARATQAAALGRMEAMQKAAADISSRRETGVPVKEGMSQEAMQASMTKQEWANYQHHTALADKTFTGFCEPDD